MKTSLNRKNTERMIKQQTLQALHPIISQNYFNFQDNVYRQITAVGMVSPISGLTADISYIIMKTGPSNTPLKINTLSATPATLKTF